MKNIKHNRKWEEMIFPCCGKFLPDPLSGVETATCLDCNQDFIPKIIIEYNKMFNIIQRLNRAWLSKKVMIKCLGSWGEYVADIFHDSRKTINKHNKMIEIANVEFCDVCDGMGIKN